MMIQPVANPISYYPLEKPESYLRRLCAANHLDLKTTLAALHDRTREKNAVGRRTVMIERLEDLAALPNGTIASTDDPATAPEMQHRCYECARIDRPRWMCLQCAQGQTVEQIRHHRTTLCLKHRRWAGPGTLPHQHIRIDLPEITAAERTFRARNLGHCPTNAIAARRITTHWALRTEPRVVAERRTLTRRNACPESILIEALSYPEAVGLMGLFADGGWLREILDNTRRFSDIQEHVVEQVKQSIPESQCHVATLVMTELKPVIARYFYTSGPYRDYGSYPENPPLPVWHHDINLFL